MTATIDTPATAPAKSIEDCGQLEGILHCIRTTAHTVQERLWLLCEILPEEGDVEITALFAAVEASLAALRPAEQQLKQLAWKVDEVRRRKKYLSVAGILPE